jgi:hypothetical protein
MAGGGVVLININQLSLQLVSLENPGAKPFEQD